MSIPMIIYYLARTWFDFNVLLPTWYLLIKANEFLTGKNDEVIPVDEQEP